MPERSGMEPVICWIRVSSLIIWRGSNYCVQLLSFNVGCLGGSTCQRDGQGWNNRISAP